MLGIQVAAIMSTILLSETFCISISPVKNNLKISVNFQCYQNSNPAQTCSSGIGYKDCYIFIKLCIRDRQFETDFPNLERCNIFENNYTIPNTRGMCKKGKIDSRRGLEFINMFHSNLDMVYIYISVNIKPKSETVPIRITIFYFYFNVIKGYHSLIMKHLQEKAKSNIKIQMNARVECLSDFYGEKCERFCVHRTDNYNCTIDQDKICTRDWKNSTCGLSDIKENFKGCCLPTTSDHKNGICEQYASCLSDVLQCNYTSERNVHSCLKPEKMPSPFISFLKIATRDISYIIGGLLLIIVILLISLLLTWKKKKAIAKLEWENDLIYKDSDTRNRFPLPTIPGELDNTDPQYSLCQEMQILNQEAAYTADTYLEARPCP